MGVRGEESVRVLLREGRHIAFQQAGGHGVPEGEGVIVGLDVPVHRPGEALLPDIFGLEGDRLDIVIGEDHPAGGVREIGNLGGVVPAGRVFALVEGNLPEIDEIFESLLVTVSVEGDAEDDLRGRDTLCDVLADGFLAAFAAHGRGVEGRIVGGGAVVRVAHVVGHHVDEIHVLDRVLEVDVLCVGGRRHGQEPVFSEDFPEVVHQQREVFGVIRGAGDAGGIAGRILPVDVDAVQTVLGHGGEAVFAEVFPVRLVGGHFAEIAGFPSADGQEDLQRGVLLLETDNLGQPAWTLDVQGFEVALDVGERIVDMGEELRIRHGRLPIDRIADDDRPGRRIRGREGSGSGTGVVVVPVVAVVGAIAAVIPVPSLLAGRRLAGSRDNQVLGRFVAREEQGQGDQKEGDQSFHSVILYEL